MLANEEAEHFQVADPLCFSAALRPLLILTWASPVSHADFASITT